MIVLLILIALVLYLVFVVAITRLLVRQGKGKVEKWSIGFIGVLVLTLLPIWDEVAGRIYFRHLCNTAAGQKIIKTVELGGDYFLKPGETDMNTAGRLPAKGGELNHEKLKEMFSIATEPERVSRNFRIEKNSRVVKMRQTGETLAVDISFFYFHGWLINSTGLHISGEVCPGRSDPYPQEFYARVFRREGK